MKFKSKDFHANKEWWFAVIFLFLGSMLLLALYMTFEMKFMIYLSGLSFFVFANTLVGWKYFKWFVLESIWFRILLAVLFFGWIASPYIKSYLRYKDDYTHLENYLQTTASDSHNTKDSNNTDTIEEKTVKNIEIKAKFIENICDEEFCRLYFSDKDGKKMIFLSKYNKKYEKLKKDKVYKILYDAQKTFAEEYRFIKKFKRDKTTRISSYTNIDDDFNKETVSLVSQNGENNKTFSLTRGVLACRYSYIKNGDTISIKRNCNEKKQDISNDDPAKSPLTTYIKAYSIMNKNASWEAGEQIISTTNSRGTKIYCLGDMSVCKTEYEVNGL
ncbi:MAG: hypothetical protein PHE73_04680 [Sulfurovaceae bacterium]|nr:hypothetical protein [Sulfurovaceae bacterium]